MNTFDKYVQLLDNNKEIESIFLGLYGTNRKHSYLCDIVEISVAYKENKYKKAFDTLSYRIPTYVYRYVKNEFIIGMKRIITKYNNGVKERLDNKNND